MEQLLTIGEFADRCGLSRSALRFYDQNDLLRPRLVDDETGYRYYAVEQLDRAALVRRLRTAEMPVGQLRQYLAAPVEERRRLLDLHLASFRQRASAVETVVDDLVRELDRTSVGGGARMCWVAPAQFAGALEQVGFAVADPAVRTELEAVWVETKDDSLRLVATDSYRLAVRDLVPDQLGPHQLRGVIVAQHVAALIAELGSADSLMLSQDPEGEISATVDGDRRTIGHRGDGFPDYERILQGLPTGDQIAVPRDTVAHALAGLPADTPELRLDFESDRLILHTGGHRAIIDGSWSGPPLRFYIDSRFFAEAVEAMVGPDLVIEAFEPSQPITLRSADTGTFSVLTMPIRVPDPE
jgi:DNA-binding transcriptional MerR regulator